MNKRQKLSQRDRWASSPRSFQPGLIPRGWDEFSGLICGFGDRESQPSTAVSVTQVHTTGVVVVDDLDHGDHAELQADALVVTRAGRVAAVKTADCVPILLIAPERAWAAAIHAGWRGTLARIVDAVLAQAAVAPMEINPDELYAAIGPSIGPCCYQVGEEVASRFESAGLAVLRGHDSRDGPRLDLRAINREILCAAGLRSSRIQVCGPCTRCRHDRYHSHRGADESGERGRQLSWVGWEDQRQEKDRLELA